MSGAPMMESTGSSQAGQPAHADLEALVKQKAHELFRDCDKEEKGFITKRDMHRLGGELPLPLSELETVFDSLDDDGNGFLTLEEFTEGFGSFLGVASKTKEEETFEKDIYETEGRGDVYEENDDSHFQEMLDAIGAKGALDNQESSLLTLWKKMKRTDPELTGDFEEFIQKISADLKQAKHMSGELENALKLKISTHDEEISKLYEEMENQIKSEKEKAKLQEMEKERRMKDDLLNELEAKDRALQDLLCKQAELERKLEKLNVSEVETRQEYDMLKKANCDLEKQLSAAESSLQETQYHVKDVEEKTRAEKRARAKAALKVSEGVAAERDSLVRQLDMLRDMNKKLRDDKDVMEARTQADRGESQKRPLTQQGSVMSIYVGNDITKRRRKNMLLTSSKEEDEQVENEDEIEIESQKLLDYTDEEGGEEDEIEVDDEFFLQNQKTFNRVNQSKTSSNSRINGKPSLRRKLTLGDLKGTSLSLLESGDEGNENSPENDHHDQNSNRGGIKKNKEKKRLQRSVAGYHPISRNEILTKDPDSPREEPLGSSAGNVDTAKFHSDSSSLEVSEKAPSRVFKVVFVGDSGVGKSSFIHRFCHNAFRSNFSATIGVDFQVRTVSIDNELVTLQLWDTAGQERFRSITKQYFRKADGVIVMYDITSETSFTNIRNWMSSVQDGTDEGTVIVLLGNKLDMEKEKRRVKDRDGQRLANEYESLFFEVSAMSGLNVNESMESMSRKLQESEDRDIENAVKLDNENSEKDEKSRCCKS